MSTVVRQLLLFAVSLFAAPCAASGLVPSAKQGVRHDV
jgi:hypothetical protein